MSDASRPSASVIHLEVCSGFGSIGEHAHAIFHRPGIWQKQDIEIRWGAARRRSVQPITWRMSIRGWTRLSGVVCRDITGAQKPCKFLGVSPNRYLHCNCADTISFCERVAVLFTAVQLGAKCASG
jgi:hypothetical protein